MPSAIRSERGHDHRPDAHADLAGGHRAGVRVRWDTGDAVLPHEYVEAAQAPRVERDRRRVAAVRVQHHEDGRDRAVLGSGLGEVETVRRAIGVVAQVDGHAAAFGVDLERDLQRQAVGHAGKRVELGRGVDPPARQRSDGLRRPVLSVVEPGGHERVHATGAELVVQLPETTLRDPSRGDHREVVAVPDLGHADPPHAHPDDVLHVGVVALHAHAGEDQRTFCVDVDGVRAVRRRHCVPDVGLVRLHDAGEPVLTLEEHGDEDRVVGRVGVAVVRIVVQERVAFCEIGMQRAHHA